ncbi:hypothetical protein WNY37_05650 [Henriciella sp. AS95]|uniref:hypothetical protein n=1 Tax=Henriciella sp. AS95 TaxID=3135782 RepID=UPI003170CA47
MKTFTTRINGGYEMPYLGVYEGEVSVGDFAELDPQAELISFGSKAKNLHLLPEFRSVRYVGLGRNTFSAELLDSLSRLPKLEVMQISHDSQEDWPSLAPLSALKYLILYDVKKQADLSFLSGMAQLESLFLSELLKLSDISALATLPNLREFAIEGDLHGRGSVLPDIDALFTLTNLEHLKFFSKKTVFNAADFQAFSKLRYIHISPFHHPFEFYAELERYLPEGCEKAVPHLLANYAEDACDKCGAMGLIKPIGSRQRAFCPACNRKKLDTLLNTYERLSGKRRGTAVAHIDWLEA